MQPVQIFVQNLRNRQWMKMAKIGLPKGPGSGIYT